MNYDSFCSVEADNYILMILQHSVAYVFINSADFKLTVCALHELVIEPGSRGAEHEDPLAVVAHLERVLVVDDGATRSAQTLVSREMVQHVLE